MKQVTLPDGRIVKVSEYDADNLLVEFEEVVTHKLVLPKSLTPEQVAEEIKKYLYGYDDPETGEHVDGYFERVKKVTKHADLWWR